MLERREVRVQGVVQGVGFRPFVYRLAQEECLAGFIGNDTDGVIIEVEGALASIESFLRRLEAEAPALARVDSVIAGEIPPKQEKGFSIVASEVRGQVATGIPADAATCADCLRELLDPKDRRYRYPFLNCTNCGPRFTITRRIPYDRPQTSMAKFKMCPACQAEYDDPANRRFHAQPNACWDCGPRVWLVEPEPAVDSEDLKGQDFSRAEESGQNFLSGQEVSGHDFSRAGKGQVDLKGHDFSRADSTAQDEGALAPEGHPDPVAETIERLLAGQILAIKGIGGFHLACDATNTAALAELRRRKARFEQPSALMMRDLELVRSFAHVSVEEERLLDSRARPIVLLRARRPSAISPLVAPGNEYLGVMLPYAPLHFVILDDLPYVIRRS